MLFGRKSGGIDWIFVFLGNPGERFEGTRHNVGFCTGDMMEKRMNVRINRLRFSALTASGELAGKKIFMMKPQTYMNLSGDAVRAAMQFYKVPTERILVFSDDISLPTAKLRVRRGGSAGGHNGIKDIIAKCGGDSFPRIKIGVSSPTAADYDLKDWVLGHFSAQDKAAMEDAYRRACDAAETVVKDGVERAMNLYNGG